MNRELFGSCLCGGVRYRIAGEPLTTVNCHCSMCRQAHGAAFRPAAHWNVASKASWFEITDALPQHAVLPRS